MVATIDLTTGLPLLTSDLIGQIPLDSQVFPYDDLHAVERPPRGPMYPDDILPTTSLVTGQDTTNPQKVQTVTTDGEHALRVYVVNLSGGGGGGGTPYQLTDVSVDNQQVHVSSMIVFPTGNSILYAASWALWIDTFYGSLPVSPCQAAVSIRGNFTNTGGHVFTMSLDDSAGSVADYSINSGSVSFGPGINLAQTTQDTNAYMYADTPVSSAALRCNIILAVSAP